jgi:UDP-N-acetylglucosamine 2-epimerase
LLEQKNATPEKVAALLRELVEDPAAREKIRTALAQWHAPKAAEQIAEIMLAAVARQPEQAAARASKCSCGCADKSRKQTVLPGA